MRKEMNVETNLVIYHGPGCADGFCAAWIAWKTLNDSTKYVSAQYGAEPPDALGRHVWILDFSYSRDTLERMAAEAKSLVVLDHHRTAQEALAGLPYAHFDMEKSGAMLTWEHFYPTETEPPLLVRYVQDRDLWAWKLESSRQISAAIASYPMEFPAWDRLSSRLNQDPESLIAGGQAILFYQNRLVESIAQHAREVEIGGHRVLAANTSVLFSEVAGHLAEGRPFGAAWFQRQDGLFVYSLRSRAGGVDVSEIAKGYGGGGHRAAAGFQVERLIEEKP